MISAQRAPGLIKKDPENVTIFMIGPKHFLLGEGGLNYAYEDYTDPEEDNEQFLEGRLFGKYEWAFTEKTKFSQSLEYLQGFNDMNMWKLNSESALVTLLTDILALKVSYSIFYNNPIRFFTTTIPDQATSTIPTQSWPHRW